MNFKALVGALAAGALAFTGCQQRDEGQESLYENPSPATTPTVQTAPGSDLGTGGSGDQGIGGSADEGTGNLETGAGSELEGQLPRDTGADPSYGEPIDPGTGGAGTDEGNLGEDRVTDPRMESGVDMPPGTGGSGMEGDELPGGTQEGNLDAEDGVTASPDEASGTPGSLSPPRQP